MAKPFQNLIPVFLKFRIVGLEIIFVATAFTGPLVLNKEGDQISGPMRTIITDKNGQIILEYSGTLLFNRITFTSTP